MWTIVQIIENLKLLMSRISAVNSHSLLSASLVKLQSSRFSSNTILVQMSILTDNNPKIEKHYKTVNFILFFGNRFSNSNMTRNATVENTFPKLVQYLHCSIVYISVIICWWHKPIDYTNNCKLQYLDGIYNFLYMYCLLSKSFLPFFMIYFLKFNNKLTIIVLSHTKLLVHINKKQVIFRCFFFNITYVVLVELFH